MVREVYFRHISPIDDASTIGLFIYVERILKIELLVEVVKKRYILQENSQLLFKK